MESHELLAMISGAKGQLSEAEVELDHVIGEIRADPLGEKTGVTAAVEAAFAKLRRARHVLGELEAGLSSGSD
jgi:hypothetical protein